MILVGEEVRGGGGNFTAVLEASAVFFGVGAVAKVVKFLLASEEDLSMAVASVRQILRAHPRRSVAIEGPIARVGGQAIPVTTLEVASIEPNGALVSRRGRCLVEEGDHLIPAKLRRLSFGVWLVSMERG